MARISKHMKEKINIHIYQITNNGLNKNKYTLSAYLVSENVPCIEPRNGLSLLLENGSQNGEVFLLVRADALVRVDSQRVSVPVIHHPI